MQTGTVSRLRFCRRSWGFKNLLQGEHCAFLEVIHLFQYVGCVRNQTSVSRQFNRIRNHFFGCRIEVRRYSRSCSMGSDCFSSWKHESEPWIERWDLCPNQREVRSTLSHNPKTMINVLDDVDLVPSNVHFSHQEALLYVFEDKRSSDQNDYKRK